MIHEFLHYIISFQKKKFLFLLTDKIIADSPKLQQIMLEIVSLQKLGIDCILYPIASINHEISHSQPLGPQDIEAQEKKQAQWQKALVKACNAAQNKLEGTNIHLVPGSFYKVQTRGVIDGVAHSHQAKVRYFYRSFVEKQLLIDSIPLLSSLAASSLGNNLLVREEELVQALIEAGLSDKIIYVDQQLPAWLGLTSGSLTWQEIVKLVPDEAWLSFFSYCYQQSLNLRFHFLDCQAEEALLSELLTAKGNGVLVSKEDSWQQLKPAQKSDIHAIESIIAEYAEVGYLRPRSLEEIEARLGSFYVLWRDFALVGCFYLYEWKSTDVEIENCYELGCFCVCTHYQNQGVGKAMLEKAKELAQEQQITRLYALTTQSMDWFSEQGFIRVDSTSRALEPLQALKQAGRNAEVYALDIVKPS